MQKKLPPSNPPWGILEAIIVLVLINMLAFMLRSFGQEYILQFIELLPGGASELNKLLVSSAIQTFLFVFFVLLIVMVKYKQDLQILGFVKSRLAHWLKLGFLNGIVLFFSVVFIGIIINWFVQTEVSPQPIAQIIMLASTRWEILIPFIVASLFAPISEEIYFRGFLYPAIRSRLGVRWGIVVTSIIFGSLHFDLFRMIPIVFGGIWLNWLYERSGSLYTSIMAHAVWNGIMTILILFSL